MKTTSYLYNMDIKEEIKRLEFAWDRAFLNGDTDRMDVILGKIKKLKKEMYSDYENEQLNK